MTFRTPILFLLLAGAGILPARAQSHITFTTTTVADAFIATGSPTNTIGSNLANDNFGHAGVLYVAPANSPDGEYQSLLRFDVSGATSLFTSTYGPYWEITGISLTLASNFGGQGEQPDNSAFNPINGGNFVIEWLADNSWAEGTGRPNMPTADGVTYASLPTLLSQAYIPLSTNTYVPPGDNIAVNWPLPLNTNIVSEIITGGMVSFRLYAADNQVSYLFNSRNFGNGNQPIINVTAAPLLKITSGQWTNGVFHLTGLGGSNQTYQVQVSTNLTANWQSLGTVMANTNGTLLFDAPAPASGQRFYRLTY
jgi:hypothetical protein